MHRESGVDERGCLPGKMENAVFLSLISRQKDGVSVTAKGILEESFLLPVGADQALPQGRILW
jgi:hypothetical protein